ncbi:dolichyl-diphosphooligosaccharide--protein glycosyltransferase [Strigomonas culicis]|uniref:dolichyl-diphosphooligosaccharide--protein glycotransferase n=1 Tax=Strigomonas culicis TaxID=28005 RepID=S9UY89_9TRYP|nr:dolichyl-diphosphooligosaccharide--protein glycosyltransferase [Strigomonas culicis]|eukprot:EPY19546.1 dolichyl-diphosphooligosaccharide--protein glycosyltransferase [Strigomonas culicis]
MSDASVPRLFGLPQGPTRAVATHAVHALCAIIVVGFLYYAVHIRLISVRLYGRLIHEFDPWFNYRATEYLSEHGWTAFFHWFDEMSWYPLGRPVGTTIYPGLQLTAVALHRGLNAAGYAISLNDVCVLMPAWFGAIATLFACLLTYEVTFSPLATAICAALFAASPAHLMRSMAGEFDNECIALAAMLLTFYLWVRALRGERAWPIGLLAGLAYGNMVAAWGGFIFVINMIALHAGVCALVDWGRGTYSPALLRAYTLFYVVGTAIATRVPPVGLTPFKSLEQLSALVVLVLLWCLHVAEALRTRTKAPIRSFATLRLRAYVLCVAVAALLVAATVFAPAGFFRPLSSRVRALFVAHTRTGNPLVDSVAEHRSGGFFNVFSFLGIVGILWLVGVPLLLCYRSYRPPATLFALLYTVAGLYFSLRMMRLLVLGAPAACLCGGAALGICLDTGLRRAFWTAAGTSWDAREAELDQRRSGRRRPAVTVLGVDTRAWLRMERWPSTLEVPLLYCFVSLFLTMLFLGASVFEGHETARSTHPVIVFSHYTRHGVEHISDYLDSYVWMRENTPKDARVLSWWDYGYQITGIANRTTLADGNTWNHEHIATIGKMLTSPVKEAHGLVRHVADYVYIWAGQSGDLGKSPHMARIGNSVYRDICAVNDPLCRHFGFGGPSRTPTPSMRASLLYNLHEHNRTEGVSVDPSLFQEVHQSKYGLVRIYKVMNVSEASRAWVADRQNHVCSAPPDTWICPGQFPPAPEIQAMLRKRINFKQLEDFGHDKKKDAYYQAYMAQYARMDG